MEVRAQHWPFEESPGDFTARLVERSAGPGGLLAGVRTVLIEEPPTISREYLERAQPAWGDKPDQFTDRVKSAHPMISRDADRHARYALAMEMIHSRNSKYALVDLVSWLLTKWPELQAEAKR